jgi:hypothetical protein
MKERRRQAVANEISASVMAYQRRGGKLGGNNGKKMEG